VAASSRCARRRDLRLTARRLRKGGAVDSPERGYRFRVEGRLPHVKVCVGARSRAKQRTAADSQIPHGKSANEKRSERFKVPELVSRDTATTLLHDRTVKHRTAIRCVRKSVGRRPTNAPSSASRKLLVCPTTAGQGRLAWPAVPPICWRLISSALSCPSNSMNLAGKTSVIPRK
jgi:hypothetical protein